MVSHSNHKIKTRVLITGVGGASVGHQILHALALVPGHYDIIAVDADPFSFGLYKTPERYIVPLAKSPQYISAIASIIEKKKVQVLIPGTEAELKALVRERATIESLGCTVLANPWSVIELCLDKLKLYSWLIANDFDTPKTVEACKWKDLVADTGYPIVGKPVSNSSGSRNVSILINDTEVRRYLESCDGFAVLFQEYIDAVQSEYTVGCCTDAEGSVIDSIILHRNLTGMALGNMRIVADRTYSLSTGYSQGFIVKNTKIQEVCERLVTSVGIRGPCNIQCRFANGKVYLFEVHPRFSGTTSLRADVGFNEPDMLIRSMIHGNNVGRQSYETDVAVIRAFQSVVVPKTEMNQISKIV
jgi:carbamoyl-phosphate synthase large subunit